MHRGLRLRLTASAVMAGLLLVVAGGTASGQIGPVTDYGGYPAPLPEGCPDGSGALTDVRWRNAAGQEASSLEAFTLVPGETFTVTWAGFDPGCLAADGSPAIAVSTKVYDAVAYPFDRSVDQRLLDGWTTCGAGVGPCPRTGDGRFALTVTLPTDEVTCVVQFGLALGLPLAIVGPNGSYYNSATRGDNGPNMLVVARNYQRPGCVTPTPTAPPTTAQGALPTTVSQPPSSVPRDVSGPAAPDNGALDNTVTAPAGPLPFTGRSLGELAALGVAITLGGALLLLSARRPTHH